MKKCVILFIFVWMIFSLEGCALLKIPGEIIGGTTNLIGTALHLADKVPWWMWI